ncbi:hypothetical protein RFI_03372 [Reticulomyxa filosa]|nr:hypothetical protein RFI_03372 [Reticulomyxa filosa]|eukprot:ETO33730.1 hypothetical protein RFI_03372 [Reticulomyxa filosa]
MKSDLENTTLLSLGKNVPADLWLAMGHWLVDVMNNNSLIRNCKAQQLLHLNSTELKRAETYHHLFALRVIVDRGIFTAQKQPQPPKQFNSNGVLFEVFDDELSFDVVIVDCIDKDNDMNNVYVTKEQLQLMQPVTKPITDLKLRKKSRRQLEDEPIRWLPEWLSLFENVKQITLNQQKSRLHFSLLHTIVMEYNNENERKDAKSSFLTYLHNI